MYCNFISLGLIASSLLFFTASASPLIDVVDNTVGLQNTASDILNGLTVADNLNCAQINVLSSADRERCLAGGGNNGRCDNNSGHRDRGNNHGGNGHVPANNHGPHGNRGGHGYPGKPGNDDDYPRGGDHNHSGKGSCYEKRSRLNARQEPTQVKGTHVNLVNTASDILRNARVSNNAHNLKADVARRGLLGVNRNRVRAKNTLNNILARPRISNNLNNLRVNVLKARSSPAVNVDGTRVNLVNTAQDIVNDARVNRVANNANVNVLRKRFLEALDDVTNELGDEGVVYDLLDEA
ncbi:uncharacterized protein B0P05DRAFT_570793 [Gilbertella persicaria]|uniref:uncharacterized protein n=1 Tax=Gilbertella persicaria TaxID=101096 RepID=UPI00221E5810|nr:uncharacterized protein B0P05DRAFT_570793 [Gilbertella persicaria]KAI8082556.1 hypothetical protein B0P05DRAFT_570793 [Gilbertella persicaria]